MPLAVLFALLTCLGCATCPPPESTAPKNGVQMAQELREETVGLFFADEDGHLAVFCTGVWISPTEILTAGHCSEAAQEDGSYPEAVGTLIWYATADEVNAVGKPPTAHHLSVVVAHDHTHDLSLLRTNGGVPNHRNAPVADKVPAQGARLSFMGQPSGLYFTYVEGVMAAYRTSFDTGNLGFDGPFLQVSAPVWFGNSGGGAFNSDGALVGISSLLTGRTPNTAFYVAGPTIQSFLKQAHAPR